jgi:hypothetical protein
MKGSDEMSLQTIILIGILTFAFTVPIIFQKSLAQNGTMGNNTFSLYTNASKPYGLTYSEWTAKWWQWAYSVPRNVNPSYDDSGQYCSEGQNAPVWFLTSSYKHAVDQYCTIP